MPHIPRLLAGGLDFSPAPVRCRRPTRTGRAYGGDAAKNRHSPLKQINRGNVAQLAPAWRYDTGEKGDTQTQPIVVGRVMYGTRPPTRPSRSMPPAASCCGVSIRASGHRRQSRPHVLDGTARNARVFAAVDNFVYALDAGSGKVIGSFGKDGRIDLREDLGRDPASQSVRLTTPGVIYRDS